LNIIGSSLALAFGGKGIFGPMGSVKGSPAKVKVGKDDGALLSLLIRLPSAASASSWAISDC